MEEDNKKDELKAETSTSERFYMSETDEIEDTSTSDDNERPSEERWAPVGANDGDNEFVDEQYKCSASIESLSYHTDRLKILEEEQEVLNSSLIALTTHFAQVQFRLRQIVDAPAQQKENLLKELEEFAFRGIPDVSNILTIKRRLSNVSSEDGGQCNNYDQSDDAEEESKIAQQRIKQRELINQLKTQLEDLERYAYETDGQDLPQSVILERQNLIINHLKEKLNFNIDDLCKLSVDDLRWQVDHAINEIVSPLKMKEQLVNQLKTQVNDLERFIHYLQGEISTETLACTCACPVHTHGPSMSHKSKKYSQEADKNGLNNMATFNTVKKVITLLHLYLVSQFGCGSGKFHRDLKRSCVPTWRDVRTRLDIAVEHVIESAAEYNRVTANEDDDDDNDDCDDDNDDFDNVFESDSESFKAQSRARLTTAVRKHLAICIRDLMQHGLMADAGTSDSVVPFIGCFPQRRTVTNNTMHAWELIVKYYEVKNGRLYNSSPAQKLSQSFNLDLVCQNNLSPKQSLLITIGNIIATHALYKRSCNSHFKAFICAALNANKLVAWLRLILQCQYLLENHYTSWSYVVKTGFQDAFHTLDRLTPIHFDLPVDLAIQQFKNIRDAF